MNRQTLHRVIAETPVHVRESRNGKLETSVYEDGNRWRLEIMERYVEGDQTIIYERFILDKTEAIKEANRLVRAEDRAHEG